MKSLIAFWNRDIINKLIVLVLLGIIVGLSATFFLIWNMPPGSLYYAVFHSTPKPQVTPPTEVPTAVPTITTMHFSIVATNAPAITPTAAVSNPLPTVDFLTPQIASATPPPPLINLNTPTPQPPTPTATLPQPVATETSLPNGTTLPPTQLLGCIPTGASQTGKVLEIIDGNTAKIMIDGVVFVVRYIGLTVPKYGEINEPYGPDAFYYNSKLVYGKTVTLYKDTSDKDPFGRLLRYVVIDQTFVNYELLRAGLAKTNETPPDTACAATLKSAEQEAMQAQKGLWLPTPTVPSP